MKLYLRIVVFIIVCIASLCKVYAYDFYEGGFYYNYVDRKSKTVEITRLGTNTYSGDVTIPESVSHLGIEYNIVGIGNSAFTQCDNLTNVSIPNSVKYFGVGAFSFTHCNFTMNIPENLDSIGSNCFYDSRICWNLVIPQGCKVGTSAFHFSQVLSVEYQEGCDSTSCMTFLGDKTLETAIFPSSMKIINSQCFSGCTKLKEIVCKAKVPPTVEEQAFYNVKQSCVVYVPVGSGYLYKNFVGWRDLTIVEDDDITATSIETTKINSATKKAQKKLVGHNIRIEANGKKYGIDGKEL